ncbi:MAG: carboxylesterase family protein, partial [Candidatus Lokiarchaeota archaeon]|nr:carboxylesterase family protein [Candidatus Lokiarchaeota archaeon]
DMDRDLKIFPASNEETEGLSGKMMDSWISFARSGNPNHQEIPDWEQYGKNRATMIFGKDLKIVNDPYSKERAIWDDILTFKN